jgi:hypothetical protein
LRSGLSVAKELACERSETGVGRFESAQVHRENLEFRI